MKTLNGQQVFDYNHPQFLERKRNLRKNQTQAEGILWSRLRRKQVNGFKFYRQYNVGSFILDFYCPELRLAIELDGGQHDQIQNRIYDDERTLFLQSKDIHVLRFWNNDIFKNINGVLDQILSKCS